MGEDVKDIKAIDVMNYLFTPRAVGMVLATEKDNVAPPPPRRAGRPSRRRSCTAAEAVAEMDEAGYEKICISAFKMWSHTRKELWRDYSNEEVYEQVQLYPDRFVGLAGYNPYRIRESLINVERGVKELGFKGVYVHALGFDVAPNDRRMYPLYAKCVELDVPVIMQIGHSLELMPSECGRPIYIDQPALDFMDLKFVASHTGWPWREELIAMAFKHPNVYADTSAWDPRHWDASWVNFVNTYGNDKVLYGTNAAPGGAGLKRFKESFLALNLSEETYLKVFRENAIRVFKL